MNPNYTKELNFKISKTNIKAQKIDGFILNTFGIVFINFQLRNKPNKP